MVARILLYIILLLIIPAALYFLFTSALFVTLPFSRQKIQEERQERIYETALTQKYLSTKEEVSDPFEEAKKFKYKFTEGSGLVLVDIMELLWPEEDDLRYGIRLTPMAKPTEWIFPNQTNTEAIIIHNTFAWRIAAVMEGDEESIKQEILGSDVSEVGSKIRHHVGACVAGVGCADGGVSPAGAAISGHGLPLLLQPEQSSTAWHEVNK